MHTFLLIFILITGFVMPSQAQSRVMQHLSAAYPDAGVIMLYHSTLNMLNVEDDPDYARMVYNIDRIKILHIDTSREAFRQKGWPQLQHDLAEQGYEELMRIRHEQLDVRVYVKQEEEIEGFFLLLYHDHSIQAVDILGSLPAGDIRKLISKIQDLSTPVSID